MQVNDVLSALIKEQQDNTAATELRTLFGTRIDRTEQGGYVSDVSGIKIFPGLPLLLEDLTNAILNACFYGSGDIMVNLPLNDRRNAELYDSGIHAVCFYAPFSSLEDYPLYRETFTGHLRTIFHVLQNTFLLDCLRGSTTKDAQQRALFFPFDLIAPDDTTGASYLVEFVREASFLRITLDREGHNRLRLRGIAHRVISDIDRGRGGPVDAAVTAASILRGIQTEAYKNTGMFVTDRLQFATYLDFLNNSGLRAAESLCFYWPDRAGQQFLLQDTNGLEQLLQVTLLLLGDSSLIALLQRGESVRLQGAQHCIWLDLSQWQRRVNVSFDAPRERIDISYFLHRAPTLARFTHNNVGALKGIRIFMVHHGTAEVLGAAKSLADMGCNGLHTLFIKYAGAMPGSYLDAILAEPAQRFSFHCLQQMSSRTMIEGYYVLSPVYSSLSGMERLNERLHAECLGFGRAMQLVGGHLFLKTALLTAARGEKMFLVEDGGYISPMINELCINGMTLGEALEHFLVDPAGPAPGDSPLAMHQPGDDERAMLLERWLAALYVGSSEVTRNGHDRLKRVEKKAGRLAFPAVSQAISRLKRGVEAEETSAAIIHSLEIILRGQGFIMSPRHALVLGCRGAIGTNLMHQLSASLSAAKVAGVDIVVEPHEYREDGPNHGSRWIERQYLHELPRRLLYDTDLIVGVVAQSILKPELLGDMLRHSSRQFICLVSGSTKTDEYSDVSNWIDELGRSAAPTIDGIPVCMQRSLIRDQETRLIQGKCVTCEFLVCSQNPAPFTRQLFLYAELMPVNFLYYGTPSEIIQEVTTQLLQVSLGSIRHHHSGTPLPGRLLAIDHEIDGDANSLAAR
ncbi:MAG: hypothetical protein BWK76_24460 [Desulfobulbaceae bacterium A2]|nr:MAG: hypothetical protein BWK76_24460 [Desulfobulbaceae bacterium A2]